MIEFSAALCTACGACAVACMDLNDIDVESGQKPYRRVYTREREGRIACFSDACRHCPDAPCAAVCPAGCLWHDRVSALTRFDSAACVGCRRCERACPFDALSFRTDEAAPGGVRMEKCHGCLGLTEAGQLPACVRACPSGALLFRSSVS